MEVFEQDRESWQALVESGNPIVDEIRRDGVSLVAGSARLLAREAAASRLE